MCATMPVPHQWSRRSNTFWSGAAYTTFQGLVVTGQSLDTSKWVNVEMSSLCFSKMCFGIM